MMEHPLSEFRCNNTGEPCQCTTKAECTKTEEPNLIPNAELPVEKCDITHVFFDIGGTLMSGMNLSPAKLLCHFLKIPMYYEHEVKDVLMTTKSNRGRKLASKLKKLIEMDYSEEHILNVTKEIWKQQIFNCAKLPYAEKAVSLVKGYGYQVGFISDCWHPFIQAFSMHFPTRPYDFNFFSYEMGALKSETSFWLMVVEELSKKGVKPENCLMIGDTYVNDVVMPSTFGMKAICITGASTSTPGTLDNISFFNNNTTESIFSQFCRSNLKTNTVANMHNLCVSLGIAYETSRYFDTIKSSKA